MWDILLSERAAAWAQALFTAVAIGAGFVVLQVQRAHDRDRDQMLDDQAFAFAWRGLHHLTASARAIIVGEKNKLLLEPGIADDLKERCEKAVIALDELHHVMVQFDIARVRTIDLLLAWSTVRRDVRLLRRELERQISWALAHPGVAVPEQRVESIGAAFKEADDGTMLVMSLMIDVQEGNLAFDAEGDRLAEVVRRIAQADQPGLHRREKPKRDQ